MKFPKNASTNAKTGFGRASNAGLCREFVLVANENLSRRQVGESRCWRRPFKPSALPTLEAIVSSNKGMRKFRCSGHPMSHKPLGRIAALLLSESSADRSE